MSVVVPELVTAEWPSVNELPTPDFQVIHQHGYGVVYVRRISGPGFDERIGWLAALVVEPAWRGQGIGRSLMRARIAALEDIVPFAGLHCEPEMVAFNERFGFRIAPNLPGPGVAMVREMNYVDHWNLERAINWREPW